MQITNQKFGILNNMILAQEQQFFTVSFSISRRRQAILKAMLKDRATEKSSFKYPNPLVILRP